MSTTTLDRPTAARRDALASRLVDAVSRRSSSRRSTSASGSGLYRALAEGGPANAARARRPAPGSRHGTRASGSSSRRSPASSMSTTRRRRRTIADTRCRPATRGPARSTSLGTAPASRVPRSAPRNGCRTCSRRIAPEAASSGRLYGPDVIEAQEAGNRPVFEACVGDWIDALPDIAARLRDGSGRVADVACGTGWSSISIARRFPGRARRRHRRRRGLDRPGAANTPPRRG